MPNLIVARHSASGITIGDSLYVFGGAGGILSIEKLNLKQNMQRAGDKFEVLDAKIMVTATDIGLLPCLSPTEVLLVGGFSPEDGRSVNQLAKFTARPVAGGVSQDLCEYTIDELSAGEMKPDFFSSNSIVTNFSADGESVVIFGAQYKHTFTGMTFTRSQAI